MRGHFLQVLPTLKKIKKLTSLQKVFCQHFLWKQGSFLIMTDWILTRKFQRVKLLFRSDSNLSWTTQPFFHASDFKVLIFTDYMMLKFYRQNIEILIIKSNKIYKLAYWWSEGQSFVVQKKTQKQQSFANYIWNWLGFTENLDLK